MGILSIPLGMGVTENPIKVSPYLDINEVPSTNPVGPAADLLTEFGLFLLTEDGDFITTE